MTSTAKKILDKNQQTHTTGDTFSEAERAAMKERVLELKQNTIDGEKVLLTKIAEMPEPDRSMALRIHQIITSNAPKLTPKTWYGMPAYANKEGKTVCFFQSAAKFKARYATLGFNDTSKLDEGNMWPTAFALKKLTAPEEEAIVTLIRKAIS